MQVAPPPLAFAARDKIERGEQHGGVHRRQRGSLAGVAQKRRPERGVGESGKSAGCAEAFRQAAEQDVDAGAAALDLGHAATAGTHRAKVMGDIDDKDRAVLAGEGGQFGQIGDPRGMGRNGGDGDDQPPAPGLAREAEEPPFHAFDRGGGAAVEPGLREKNSLEHGRMRGGIDDDVIARTKQRAQRLADRLGAGGKGQRDGTADQGDETVFQRKNPGSPGVGRGGQALPVQRGEGGRAEVGMAGEREIVLQGEVQARPQRHRRRMCGRVEGKGKSFVQGGVEGPGHGRTFPAVARDGGRSDLKRPRCRPEGKNAR